MPHVFISKNLLFSCFFVLIAAAGFAQHSGEQKLFEFTVEGMSSEKDAKSLDSLMLTKKGIYSSKTDFKTKKIEVKTIPQLDFGTVKSVLTVLRLEATDKDLKVTVIPGM
jgi:hypothetical protein